MIIFNLYYICGLKHKMKVFEFEHCVYGIGWERSIFENYAFVAMNNYLLTCCAIKGDDIDNQVYIKPRVPIIIGTALYKNFIFNNLPHSITQHVNNNTLVIC